MHAVVVHHRQVVLRLRVARLDGELEQAHALATVPGRTLTVHVHHREVHLGGSGVASRRPHLGEVLARDDAEPGSQNLEQKSHGCGEQEHLDHNSHMSALSH